MTESPREAPDAAMRAAELLHDQAEYLLNDELGYASSLRDARRTLSTVIAVIVGIGVFRIELSRPENHVPTIPPWAEGLVRLMFILALLAILFGAYYIHTERALHREFASLKSQKRSGGALSVLYLRQEVFERFLTLPPLDVIKMKAEGLRLAYSRLRDANRRVRARLAIGTFWIFAGVVLVLTAFAIYTSTVDYAKGSTNEPGTDSSQPAEPERS